MVIVFIVKKTASERFSRFLEKAKLVHNGLYIYDKVNYINGKIKVVITCPIHGDFNQTPEMHAKGQGCPKCGNLTISKKLTTQTTDSFVERATTKHGDKYIYTNSVYSGADSLLKIICPIPGHGMFEQTPYVHIFLGCGCPKCGRVKTERAVFDKAASKFIDQCAGIHKNKYDYSITVYTGWNNLIKVICPKHGTFQISANHHLFGAGCQKCSTNVSYSETKWLDSLKIASILRNKVLKINGTRINADGYDPATNTIYEFYGDFWHGNPKIYNADDINSSNKKKFGELYSNTMEREKFLKENGFNVVSIWEYDFYKRGSND